MRKPDGVWRAGDPDDLFDKHVIAEWFDVSYRSVERWFERGDLPSVKVGNTRKATRADIQALYQRMRAESAIEPATPIAS